MGDFFWIIILKKFVFNKTQTFRKNNANIGAVKYSHKIKRRNEEEMNMNRNDQQFEAQRIRTQYTEKQTTELGMLKELDAKVKRPANVFAYIFGSIGAIIMGAGMSLTMTDIGAMIGMENTMFYGILIGVIGMGLAFVNYPIYKSILKSRKKKYGQQIIELSEKIINQ